MLTGSSVLGIEVKCLAGDKQPDDQAKEAENGAEDLDDENLDEARKEQVSLRNSSAALKGKSYSVGSAASARAAPLPLIPTATPHMRLHMPTVMPDQKRA